MGGKLLWTGLTFIEAATILHIVSDIQIVGAVIMALGCVLMWLDR